MMPLLKIKLFETHNPKDTQDLTCSPEDIGFESGAVESFGDTIHVRVKTRRDGDLAVLDAFVQTVVNLECDRCLQEFTREIDSSFSLVVRQLKQGEVLRKSERDEDSDDESDIIVIDSDTNEIDISENVHDALLLDLPVKTICREDCKGLCAHCGENLNEGECRCSESVRDHRWDALAGLTNNDTEK